MFTLENLKALLNGDGATLKNGETISYKTGWQVATEGKETQDVETAYNYINEYAGNCGVWYENGIYYIDKSHRVKTKREALEVGRAHKQISVYSWQRGNLAYC